MSRDTTERIVGFDAFFDHTFADKLHCSQRCTAGTRLDREAIFEVATIDDHLCSLLCQKNVAWVLRIANSAGSDL